MDVLCDWRIKNSVRGLRLTATLNGSYQRSKCFAIYDNLYLINFKVAGNVTSADVSTSCSTVGFRFSTVHAAILCHHKDYFTGNSCV